MQTPAASLTRVGHGVVWQRLGPAQGGQGVMMCVTGRGSCEVSSTELSSLFPLLNTALQVWILCSQRNGGPHD